MPKSTQLSVMNRTIESLSRQGKSSANDLLEFAEPENSPIHDYFTWDNDEAARRLRLLEAGKYLMLNIKIVRQQENRIIIDITRLKQDRLPVPTPLPSSRVVKSHIARSSDPVKESPQEEGQVVTKGKTRDERITQGIIDLKTWVRLYLDYDELMACVNMEIVNAIDEKLGGV